MTNDSEDREDKKEKGRRRDDPEEPVPPRGRAPRRKELAEEIDRDIEFFSLNVEIPEGYRALDRSTPESRISEKERRDPDENPEREQFDASELFAPRQFGEEQIEGEDSAERSDDKESAKFRAKGGAEGETPKRGGAL